MSAAAAAAAELSTSKRKAPHSKRVLPSTGKRHSKKTKLQAPRQCRLTREFKDARNREREVLAQQKATERATREAIRLERKLNVQEIQQARKKFVAEQKEAALKRAAELVSSNRVPIELTRGRAAAKAAQASVESEAKQNGWRNKSAVVVSTAADLHKIVTFAKNLYAKVRCSIERMYMLYSSSCVNSIVQLRRSITKRSAGQPLQESSGYTSKSERNMLECMPARSIGGSIGRPMAFGGSEIIPK